MTTPTTAQVECDQLHPSLAVGDVLAAADFYVQKLGFELSFTWGDPPTMAGVTLGHVQLFLEQGTPNPKGCAVRALPLTQAARQPSGLRQVGPSERDMQEWSEDASVDDPQGDREQAGNRDDPSQRTPDSTDPPVDEGEADHDAAPSAQG